MERDSKPRCIFPVGTSFGQFSADPMERGSKPRCIFPGRGTVPSIEHRCSLLRKYFSSITHQKEIFCMRKLIMPILAVPMLILAIVAMSPLSVFAAPKLHTPHFYQKGNAKGLATNLRYFGRPLMDGTANVYAIFWVPSAAV